MTFHEAITKYDKVRLTLTVNTIFSPTMSCYRLCSPTISPTTGRNTKNNN